jgi:hypothetical protein
MQNFRVYFQDEKITPDDLPQALKWFKEQTGHPARYVYVPPAIHDALEKVIPAGLTLDNFDRLLPSELMFSVNHPCDMMPEGEVRPPKKPCVINKPSKKRIMIQDNAPLASVVALNTNPIQSKTPGTETDGGQSQQTLTPILPAMGHGRTRGRPVIIGATSRSTLYRRRKEAEAKSQQGILIQ